jgi:hypothetical protein
MHMRTTITVALLLTPTACGLLGTFDLCDPASPLYPHLTREEKAECEMSETGDETGESAWCFRNPEDPNNPDAALRDWCYPIEHPVDQTFYIAVECAAVFDFDAWNYDGSCDPGNGCAETPTTARICFGPGDADTVSDKPPGDQSVRLCREDAEQNGDTEPSLYLTYDYTDNAMLDPLCDVQEYVDEIGPVCTHDQGAVCLSHNLFCACKCSSDADCESPSVCEGYHPGEFSPSFCVTSQLLP